MNIPTLRTRRTVCFSGAGDRTAGRKKESTQDKSGLPDSMRFLFRTPSAEFRQPTTRFGYRAGRSP